MPIKNPNYTFINETQIKGKPFVTVSNRPTSASGCDFGTDSAASVFNPSNLFTTTGGQAEADSYLVNSGGGVAPP